MPTQNPRESTCLNCLRCQDACPEHLWAGLFTHQAQNGQQDEWLEMARLKCRSCGACEASCLAGLSLRHAWQSILPDQREENVGPPFAAEDVSSCLGRGSQMTKTWAGVSGLEFWLIIGLLFLYADFGWRWVFAAPWQFAFLLSMAVFGDLVSGRFFPEFSGIPTRTLALALPVILPAGFGLGLPFQWTASLMTWGFTLLFGLFFFGGFGRHFLNPLALASVFFWLNFGSHGDYYQMSPGWLGWVGIALAISGAWYRGFLDSRLFMALGLPLVAWWTWHGGIDKSPEFLQNGFSLNTAIGLSLFCLALDPFSLPRTSAGRWSGGLFLALFFMAVPFASWTGKSPLIGVLTLNLISPFFDYLATLNRFSRMRSSP